MEIWKKIPIKGYKETYEISSLGRLRNYKRNKIVQPDKSDKRGYINYNLYYQGKKIKKGAHVLMGLAFIPNPENKPTINHEDGIKSNNILSNLSWATCKEQIRHAINTGLKKQKGKPVFQCSMDGKIINKFATIKLAAENINGLGTSISAVCKGKRKSHKNFKWKYVEEKDKKNNKIPLKLPKGKQMEGFSQYIFIEKKDDLNIYSLFRHSFISIRKPKNGYNYFVLIDDNNKRRNISPKSILNKIK